MKRVDYDNNELKKYIHKNIVSLKIPFLKGRGRRRKSKAIQINLKVMIKWKTRIYTCIATTRAGNSHQWVLKPLG